MNPAIGPLVTNIAATCRVCSRPMQVNPLARLQDGEVWIAAVCNNPLCHCTGKSFMVTLRYAPDWAPGTYPELEEGEHHAGD